VSALPTIAARDLPPIAYAHPANHAAALTHPDRFRPVVGDGWVKPDKGGLWTAPVTATGPNGEPTDTAWLQWCRSEDFGSNTHLTLIVPELDARVLLIDRLADLVAIVDEFPSPSGLTSGRCYPAWTAIAAAGWDAVCLTDAGQWATRLSRPDLYGWDAATVFWLRPSYTVGATFPIPTGCGAS
jgi:hypothetical protein